MNREEEAENSIVIGKLFVLSLKQWKRIEKDKETIEHLSKHAEDLSWTLAGVSTALSGHLTSEQSYAGKTADHIISKAVELRKAHDLVTDTWMHKEFSIKVAFSLLDWSIGWRYDSFRKTFFIKLLPGCSIVIQFRTYTKSKH